MPIKFLDEEQPTSGKVAFTDAAPVAAETTPTPAPTQEVDLTKPAFVAPRQRATELKKVQAAAEADRNAPKFTWQQLSTDEDLQKIQRDFLKIRTGKDFTNVSGEDLSKQFMSSVRADEWNTFDTISYLNKLKNAPGDDKEKLALGKLVAEQTKSALEKGGQPGAQPYIDAIGSALLDFTNYLGLGTTALAKRGAVKAATKTATTSALGKTVETGIKAKAEQLLTRAATMTPGKVVAVGTGTEAVVGAGQDVMQQKAEIATSEVLAERRPDLGVEKKELDPTRIGAAALFSSVFGFAEAKGQMALKPGKTGQEQLNELLQDKIKAPADPNAAPTKAERVLTDPVTENMDKVVEEFMNIQGGRILDDINPATALTDAKVQKDLSGRAVRVALYVMEQDPSFRVKPGQKTSTAIAEVFSNLDNIDDAVLEQAIRKEGLTPEEFAQANKLTVTEAAQVMQQYSVAAKAMARLSQIDPVFKEQADLLFGKPDEYTSAMGRVGQMISSLERESKAWVVSGIGTTVRNVIGTGVGLTYNSAASLIEGTLYTIGRTAKAAIDPKSSAIDTLKNGVGDTMRDAFGVYGHLLKSDLSAATTDVLLQHNPALRNNILSATQESSTNEISKAAKLFNSLNVAQDAFFRRAIFNASVEKHMRKLGLDMYETIAEGKTIPASILKEATDETLKATFSYTPKQQKHGIKSFEAGAEGIGNLFVKAAEYPGGSLLATFPRFMSNAIAFQYRYSVFGGASGATDILNGARRLADGDETGRALVNKGMENFSKGVVGTAALAAAYDYRMNNQDTEWYNMKNDNGTVTDVRAIFPLGPTLAVADFMAKRKQGLEPKTAEMVESIVGMKMPAGTQNQFLDQVFAAFSSEKEADKIEIAVAKVLGDFTARFASPFVFKSAYEFFDMFREEGAVQRDPNVILSEGRGDRFIEAAVNRVQSKLPVVKEELPAAVPRLREGPIYKEGEFFNTFIGVREVPEKTPEEQEINRLGIDPYQLYGPSSGDRKYDRAYVENANPMVIKTIQRVLANERYQSLPIVEQKMALTNSVRDILSVARDKTDAQFTAADLDRVKKMRFNKLSADARKIINDRYAKDNNGVTLEEANDYRAVDKYEAMLGNLQFAAGGLVPKFAGGGIIGKGLKAVGKAAADIVSTPSTLLKKAAPVADDAEIDAIVNKNLSTTPAPKADVFNQMTDVLTGKPAPKPAATAKKQPLAAQTEQAIPAPTPKEEIAPTPSGAFTDDDYALGEQNMVKNIGMDEAALKSWKINNYDDYMNTVHVYTGMAKGIGYKDMPPSPFIKKMDEGADALVDEVEYDIDGNPIGEADNKISAGVKKLLEEEDRAYYGIDEKYLSGDMNSTVGKSIDRRKTAISAIKEYREDAFFKMRNDDKFASFDDEVIGTVLGDYRYSKGKELNPRDANDVAEAVKMATTYQNKLDQLREKYKDMPAMKLFHGQGETESIEGVLRNGFRDPQKGTWAHSEMMVGAPSFTRDINLGMRGSPFGGTNPKNYVVTEMPYADYVFTRINMAADKYDKKDINTILRSVTGAPDVVRPVSLPRAGYLETEDMIVEAEKLRVKGSKPRLRSAEKDVAEAGVPLRSEHKAFEEAIDQQITKTLDTDDSKEAMRNAYKTYGMIRELMSGYMDMAKGTSVKTGLGQQYQQAINIFAESKIARDLEKVADVLETGGAKQKARNLYMLREKLEQFRKSEPTWSSATSEAKRTKPLEEVTKMIPKLAKGGLASKRR